MAKTLAENIKFGIIGGLSALLLSTAACSDEPWDPTGKYESSSSSSSCTNSSSSCSCGCCTNSNIIIIIGDYQKSSESNSAGYSN